MSQNNGHSNNGNTSLRLKTGLAEMLKGGVIMDVTDAKQAEIAERAGAVAVMALERVPAQIRAEGGVARMASPKKIREIMATVSIPVMAKCRMGILPRRKSCRNSESITSTSPRC
jgi:pyridoxal 5'-phosphate synthase pdxS subunit